MLCTFRTSFWERVKVKQASGAGEGLAREMPFIFLLNSIFFNIYCMWGTGDRIKIKICPVLHKLSRSLNSTC